MSKEEFLKIQTCILKVNIHCDGCKKKVKKTLQKIDGVYTTTVDAENGKVTVSGNVDAATLIKKLGKAGKHAELLFPKGGGDKKGQQLNGQLEKLLADAGKGGQKDVGKPQKGGGGGDGQKIQQPNPLQQLKMFKDLNFPPTKDPKDLKSVKFVLPEEEEDGSDFDDEFDDEDDFDDDYDDELDGFDDDLEDDIKDMKAKIINGGGQPVANEKKGGGGGGNNNNNNTSAKKGGGGDVNAQNKFADAKNSSGGKSGGGGGGGAGGGGKNGGGGGAPQDGKNGGNNKAAGNNNGNNNGKDGGGKQSGGKGGAGGAPGGHQMNHQAMMAQMANMNMNMPMGNNPGAAVQGLPARAPPGYFPGGTITPEMIATANPYQQQYMAAMMQQQRTMMNGQERGYQPMAYLRPPPVAAYMAPPPEYTHFFSDENTGSCSIM